MFPQAWGTSYSEPLYWPHLDHPPVGALGLRRPVELSSGGDVLQAPLWMSCAALRWGCHHHLPLGCPLAPCPKAPLCHRATVSHLELWVRVSLACAGPGSSRVQTEPMVGGLVPRLPSEDTIDVQPHLDLGRAPLEGSGSEVVRSI